MIQKSFIGYNSSEELSKVVDCYSPKSVLVVRDKNSYSICGSEEIISHALSNKAMEVMEFYDFKENPKIEDVNKGLKLLQGKSVDLIIGVGGGSVMDMSKLIRFLWSYQTDEVFVKHERIRDIIPLIAMPTTAGTGAEATHFAVVYRDKKKYSLAHDDVLADVAIVDPVFTYKIPKYITACTGFDALAQAIEAFWNKNATSESDKYALKAIDLIFPNLPIAVNNSTVDARNAVSEGSYLAGKAINITKTTAPHAFSYPFTSYYGLPHGHAVAMTFPFFIDYNYVEDYNGDKMRRLYKLLGIKSKNESRELMIDYINNIGLKLDYSNISKELIINNVNFERLSNNPVEVSNDVLLSCLF